LLEVSAHIYQADERKARNLSRYTSLKEESAAKLLINLIKVKSSTRWIKVFRVPIPLQREEDIHVVYSIAKTLSKARRLLTQSTDAGHFARFTRTYMSDILRVLGQDKFCHYIKFISNCEKVLD